MSYATLKSILVFLGFALSVGVFIVEFYQELWMNLRRGREVEPFRQWGKRLAGLGQYVFAQARLFRFPLPGVGHFVIFWGFLILSFTILQAIVEGLVAFSQPHYVLPIIGDWGPLVLLQELFAVLVALAVIYALYTRLVVNPERYQGSHRGQGVMVLLFIFTIMTSLVVMNGARLNLGVDLPRAWMPVSRQVGALLRGQPDGVQFMIGEASYWIHLGVVFVFLTELPRGKHFHVVTALPAVLLRNLDPPGRLPAAPEFDDEIGVSVVERFSWRQMLDFYTCTECGYQRAYFISQVADDALAR